MAQKYLQQTDSGMMRLSGKYDRDQCKMMIMIIKKDPAGTQDLRSAAITVTA